MSNRRTETDDDIDLPVIQKTTYYSVPLGYKHEFYLSGSIDEPEKYAEWFHLIRNSSENDEIILHINSPGGDASTAIQLMRVLKETQAHVTASVEGLCMSAATFVFLSAHSYEISEYSDFMFHNYSSITMGKGGEMFDSITHEKKWSENLMKTVYKDFLTDTEIQQILDNKDIWMEGDEVLERLKTRNEKILAELEVKNSEETKKESEKDSKKSLLKRKK